MVRNSSISCKCERNIYCKIVLNYLALFAIKMFFPYVFDCILFLFFQYIYIYLFRSSLEGRFSWTHHSPNLLELPSWKQHVRDFMSFRQGSEGFPKFYLRTWSVSPNLKKMVILYFDFQQFCYSTYIIMLSRYYSGYIGGHYYCENGETWPFSSSRPHQDVLQLGRSDHTNGKGLWCRLEITTNGPYGAYSTVRVVIIHPSGILSLWYFSTMDLGPFAGLIYTVILLVDCLFFLFLEWWMPREDLHFVRHHWNPDVFKEVCLCCYILFFLFPNFWEACGKRDTVFRELRREAYRDRAEPIANSGTGLSTRYAKNC